MKSAIKTGVVTEFRDEYRFLSNFYTRVFEWRGHHFFCGEQAFAWAKTLYPAHPIDKLKCDDLGKRLLDTGNPSVAKKYGRGVPLDVATWDAQRIPIMREITHAKFSVDGMAGQLLNTGAMMLVEGNTWNDTFWGRCNGKGFNHLGVILMEERGYWLHHEFGE